MPAFANDSIQLQVFGWAFVLGMIALSLMFLAGYGGMVSLVQMTVAGCAGYMYAIFGHSAFMEVSLGWPWWATIPIALVIAVIFGTISGALAVRTEGIYTIMNHARDRLGLLLLHPPELHHLQRLQRLPTRSGRLRSSAWTGSRPLPSTT